MDYPARTGYLDDAVPASYEEDRFSGRLGGYRNAREQRGVGAMLDLVPDGLVTLDCPCGTGRWWPVLARKSKEIIARDISPAMLEAATRRIETIPVPVTVEEGDAENLGLPDDSVDLAFSHALTKHLPIPAQQQVLAELARVSRSWVICSFSVFGRLSYEVWRRRTFLDSHPLLPEQLRDLAAAAGLEVRAMRSCSTPLGVERSVLFAPAGASAGVE